MERTRRRRIVPALALFAVAAGCSDQGDDATPSTIAATTTTLAPSVVTDGRLVIGVLVPSGDTVIGEPMRVAVDTAVDLINEAGGVLGNPVTAVVADEGESTAAASSAIQSLIELDADAIIGPASSLNALGSLDEIVAAGKVACSPTASAIALDDFPDDGLFFRTIPSDSLQAVAIADATDQTGAQRVAVVYIDDAYGRAFADEVAEALQGGASVIETVAIPTDVDDLDEQVAQLVAADAQVAIVLADGDDGSQFLAALDDADTSGLANILVNDALRNPTSPQRIADLRPELREKILGLAPQAESDAEMPFEPSGPFAMNAFDCVNLIALSAVRAESDSPLAIAEQIPGVSANGSPCQSFATCVEALRDGLQINYDGPSGLTELQLRQGDPQRAIFDRFTFDDAGADVLQRTVTVGL